MGYTVKVAEVYLNDSFENKKEMSKIVGILKSSGYGIIHVDDNTVEITKEVGEENEWLAGSRSHLDMAHFYCSGRGDWIDENINRDIFNIYEYSWAYFIAGEWDEKEQKQIKISSKAKYRYTIAFGLHI